MRLTIGEDDYSFVKGELTPLRNKEVSLLKDLIFGNFLCCRILEGREVAICVRNHISATTLMVVLESFGVKWADGRPPTFHKHHFTSNQTKEVHYYMHIGSWRQTSTRVVVGGTLMYGAGELQQNSRGRVAIEFIAHKD